MPRVNCNVNHGLQAIMICHCRFTNCKKKKKNVPLGCYICMSPWEDISIQHRRWTLLYFLINFVVKPEK